MDMEQEREAYRILTLDSEDKVLASYSVMKSRYNRMLTRMKKILYAWMAEYDVTDVLSAQQHWFQLEKDLRQELDEEFSARWSDVKTLMVEIFTFNYLYALESGSWERDLDDDSNLEYEAILVLLGIAWAADGLSLEERMRKRKSQLIAEVHKIIVQQIAIGVPKAKLWEAVLHEAGKPKYRGSTQITDEAQYIANEAVKRATESRTDGYTISEILDYKTCKFCRSMDRKHFNWNEYAVGVTAPLFHPRCRGRIIPDRK